MAISTKRRTKTSRASLVGKAGWTCSDCGAANDAAVPSCLSCSSGLRPDLDDLQRLLVDALEPTVQQAAEWTALRAGGATDAEIQATICAALLQQGVRYCIGERYNLVWNGVADGIPEIWYMPANKPRALEIPDYPPELAGEKLVDAVRELFGIGRVESRGSRVESQKAEKGIPGPSPRDAAAGSNGKDDRNVDRQRPTRPATNADARDDKAQTRELAIGLINVPQGANPRKAFDKAALEQLAESIKVDGIVQPLAVRWAGGGWELLAGERRLRAAKLAKLATVPVIVKDCDDAAAARIRLVENFIREDLNPIEEAAAFQELLDKHGFSQRELADYFGLSQGKIANSVRLLKLPKTWQEKVISQEITATNARDLATWAETPAIINKVAKDVKNHQRWHNGAVESHEFRRIVRSAVRDCSRPLSGSEFCGGRYLYVALTKKDAQREDLDVRDVFGEKRAFNITLWEELHKAGEKRREQSRKAKDDRATSTNRRDLSPEEKRRRTQQKREQWQKRLYRWKVAWLQQRVIERLKTLEDGRLLMKVILYFACQREADGVRSKELGEAVKAAGGRKVESTYWTDVWKSLSSLKPGQFPELVRAAAIAWVSHSFEGYRSDVEPAMIEGLAADLGIDFAGEWRLTEEFLQLHTREQLAGLAKEWKVELRGGKVTEIVANLQADAADATVPKELVTLKPVRLM